jgi:predicted DNA-binding transcriptional regulator AlpA
MQKRLLSERDVENEYGVKARTLQNWRLRNQGPQFRKLSNKMVRYERNALDEWIRSQPSGGQGGAGA